MPRDELVYVSHMLAEVRDALYLVGGLSQAEFLADLAVRKAVAHSLQTLGEAARRLSPEFQASHPEIPWPEIIGMRHKIVHDYFEVSYTIVWDVVGDELPQLAAQLVALLPEEQE